MDLGIKRPIQTYPADVLSLVPFASGGGFTLIERAAVRLKEQAPADDMQELESLLAMFATRRFPDELILRQRFGEPPADVTEALDREDVATLEAVLSSAVTASIEQIRIQLGLQTL